MDRYDVAVIGGGIVGSAVLRELAEAGLRTVLLEREPDICEGTSKANSGIIHTGFDARPGTVEARLLAESRDLWPDLVKRLRIPYLRCGALMLALDAQELERMLGPIAAAAGENGVAVIPLTPKEVQQRVPAVSPTVAGGLFIGGEGIVDPFQATRAFAEAALTAGADIFLGEAVVGLEPTASGAIRLRTTSGRSLIAEWVINAAGLWADELARLAGDDSFTLTPRKGEFLLVENDHGIAHILLPVPTPISKGILVTPVVFGGLLLGPTAEDVADKFDRSTTAAGMERIRSTVARMVPALKDVHSLRQFAGVRAVSSTGDYIINPSPVLPRLVHVAGIRSTGVSAAPGIARAVARLLDDAGLVLRSPLRVRRDEILSGATRAQDGKVTCLCRAVTQGEITAALQGPLPPHNLDGVKRRTGAMLGLCQGNLCAVEILALMAQQLGIAPEHVVKHRPGSHVVVRACTGGPDKTDPLFPHSASPIGPDHVPSGDEEADVVVVGAGLSGIAVARACAGVGRVVVLEWSARPGGFMVPASGLPCMTHVAEVVQRVLREWPPAVELRLEHTATGLLPEFPAPGRHAVVVQSRAGTYRLITRYVVVASGAFEVPREHLGIPGDRPAGVVTACFVHRALMRGWLPGRRAVIFGSGPYAIQTRDRLQAAGVEVVAHVDPERGERVVHVRGHMRVEAVMVERRDGRSEVTCDTLVVVAGLVPNLLWLKGTGLEGDAERGGLVTNAAGETRLAGVFAAGTCTQPDPLHRHSIVQGEAVGHELARRLRGRE